MNKGKRKIVLLFLMVSLMVQAQGVIDEVIWVVGDEAILRSEVEEERLRWQYEGQQIAGDPEAKNDKRFLPRDLFQSADSHSVPVRGTENIR